MGLNSRARRLVAARGIGRTTPRSTPGLAWCTEVLLDRSKLRPGAVVICDHVVLDRRWPEDPDLVEVRERVSLGPGDVARVLAWDGSIIGFPVFGKKGGVILDFVWPEGLPDRDPAAVAAADG